MRVAFCNRPGYDNPLGGDAIQMLKTKENLERLFNVEIEIVTDPVNLSKDFDLVHIFNYATYTITEKFFEKANYLQIPIASSPIYWDYSYNASILFRKFLGYPTHISERRILLERKLAGLYYTLMNKSIISPLFRNKVGTFIKLSSAVLPNSKEEGDLLFEFAGIEDEIERAKVSVVYNAVDNESLYCELSEDDFCKKHGIPKNYVLTVGRIEYVKNQLNLIYALRNHPEIPIVIVGHNTDRKYLEKLHELANRRGNTYFLSAVPHNDIKGFYRYAKCHVLLSLRESPGLVSLEAQQQGCPIVVATKEFAPTKTYFHNCNYVVNPLRINEVEKVILKAFESQRDENPFKNNFTWDVAAEQTYSAYKRILEEL